MGTYFFKNLNRGAPGGAQTLAGEGRGHVPFVPPPHSYATEWKCLSLRKSGLAPTRMKFQAWITDLHETYLV